MSSTSIDGLMREKRNLHVEQRVGQVEQTHPPNELDSWPLMSALDVLVFYETLLYVMRFQLVLFRDYERSGCVFLSTVF